MSRAQWESPRFVGVFFLEFLANFPLEALNLNRVCVVHIRSRFIKLSRGVDRLSIPCVSIGLIKTAPIVRRTISVNCVFVLKYEREGEMRSREKIRTTD